MNVNSEYVQEEGGRGAQIITSPHSTLVIVSCTEDGNIVEDHVCSDLETAHQIAEEWVFNGTAENEEN